MFTNYKNTRLPNFKIYRRYKVFNFSRKPLTKTLVPFLVKSGQLHFIDCNRRQTQHSPTVRAFFPKPTHFPFVHNISNLIYTLDNIDLRLFISYTNSDGLLYP